MDRSFWNGFRHMFAGSIVLLVFVLSGLSCRQSGEVQELVLLHTNDSHGSVVATDSIGGLAERATFIRQVRERNKNVLLVDAGDINAGQPVSNMADAKPDIAAYNHMRYDVATAGNHEFDKPVSVFLEQMKAAEFPFVISNVELEGKLLGKPYIIKEYGEIRVGLFGVVTKNTRAMSVGASHLVFLDEEETARQMVKILKDKGVNIIIALTHLGFTETTPDYTTSIKLVSHVDGIDIAVDGHSHSYLDKPMRVNDTWVVTANMGGRYVGEGKLTFREGKLEGFDWKPVLIKGFAPDPEVMGILEPFIVAAERDLKTVIGTATGPFELQVDGVNIVRRGESALGNLVADALYWKAKKVQKWPVDFALTNSGGIRQGLPEGKITKNDVMTTLPFNNVLEVVAMKGSDVRRLFDFVAGLEKGVGAFPQVSKEVRLEIDGQKKKVRSLTIGGEAVSDTATYYMATCDYIAAGKDGYSAGLGGITDKLNTSCLLSTVLIDYIEMRGVVTPETDGRILRTEGHLSVK